MTTYYTYNEDTKQLTPVKRVLVRDGKKQYIIEKNCGKATFEEWENWIKDLNDNLPDFEPLTGLDIYSPPPLKPVVIDGVLREGFKMRLQGPSKAGKSFALIELAIAMAEGIKWLGHQCKQGRADSFRQDSHRLF